MKKFIAALFASFMLIGLFSVATAGADHQDGPGPNGSNNKGLCTAYFNGQKNGHEPGNSPGPFGSLEDHGEDPDDDNGGTSPGAEMAADVFEYCQQYGIGGNPEQSGRWTCTLSDGDDEGTDVGPSEYQCEDNEAPGNSGNSNARGNR